MAKRSNLPHLPRGIKLVQRAGTAPDIEAPAKRNPCRDPEPPPFAVGTKLVCVADRGDCHAPAVRVPRDSERHPEDWVRIGGKGLEVVIDEVKLGHRGTGHQLRDHDGPMFYDEGDPIIDQTRDGYSVYHVTINNGGKVERAGRLIDHDSRKDWKVIP